MTTCLCNRSSLDWLDLCISSLPVWESVKIGKWCFLGIWTMAEQGVQSNQQKPASISCISKFDALWFCYCMDFCSTIHLLLKTRLILNIWVLDHVLAWPGRIWYQLVVSFWVGFRHASGLVRLVAETKEPSETSWAFWWLIKLNSDWKEKLQSWERD